MDTLAERVKRAYDFHCSDSANNGTVASTMTDLSTLYDGAPLDPLEGDAVGQCASIINLYFQYMNVNGYACSTPFSVYEAYTKGFVEFVRRKGAFDEQQWTAFYRAMSAMPVAPIRTVRMHDVASLVRNMPPARIPPFWNSEDAKKQFRSLHSKYGIKMY